VGVPPGLQRHRSLATVRRAAKLQAPIGAGEIKKDAGRRNNLEFELEQQVKLLKKEVDKHMKNDVQGEGGDEPGPRHGVWCQPVQAQVTQVSNTFAIHTRHIADTYRYMHVYATRST